MAKSVEEAFALLADLGLSAQDMLDVVLEHPDLGVPALDAAPEQTLEGFLAYTQAWLAEEGPRDPDDAESDALMARVVQVLELGDECEAGWNLCCLACQEYAAECRCGGHGHKELPF